MFAAELFFLSREGLLFGLLLALGHLAGYALVRFTRRVGWHDFSAVGMMSALVALVVVSGVLFDLWYIHSFAFGALMGTTIFLATGVGRAGSDEPSV